MNTLPAAPVNTLDDLKNYSAFILLYPAGASGEFLASALTESLEGVAKSSHVWQSNGTSVSYKDWLGHALKSGFDSIEDEHVIKKANQYISQVAGSCYLILAHPGQSTFEFIRKYLSSVPIIEISIYNKTSRKFADLAAVKKVPRDWTDPPFTLKKYKKRGGVSGYKANKHLVVEWEDIFINQTEKNFNTIAVFLNKTGDHTKFNMLVQDYLQRNQEILNEIQ